MQFYAIEIARYVHCPFLSIRVFQTKRLIAPQESCRPERLDLREGEVVMILWYAELLATSGRLRMKSASRLAWCVLVLLCNTHSTDAAAFGCNGIGLHQKRPRRIRMRSR